MSDVTRTLVRHRTRINDIVAILARYGFAVEWAARGTGIQGVSVVERMADHFTESDLRELGTGERLWLMPTRASTTWVKLDRC